MHDRTTYGLYCWSKSLFEKLGWMTLAHQDCQLIQLKCYVENIHILIQHIELNLQYLHDLHKKHHSSHGLEEKIHDMEILHGNMKVLIKHAEHLVKTCKKEKVIKAVKKVGSKKMMKGGNGRRSESWLRCDKCTTEGRAERGRTLHYCDEDHIYQGKALCKCKWCKSEKENSGNEQ